MEGGPPCFSPGSTCPMILRYLLCRFAFAYETFTLFDLPFQDNSASLRKSFSKPSTPSVFLPQVWPLPISLATTLGITVVFSSSSYLDVSVRRVPFTQAMYSPCDRYLFSNGVSPFGNPRVSLFAANHGLSQLVTSFVGS